MTPADVKGPEGAPAVARMVLDKSYQGDLSGTGRGQMVSHMTAVEGSAGYVAVELVEGILAGRVGSFVLQHFGLMDRGEPTLRVAVVPDSGTGELSGVSGELDIVIENGMHHYVLEYEIGDQRSPTRTQRP